MNDEIKEVLERRKNWYLHQQKNNGVFNDEDYMAYMVLDYITNLQHTKEYLGEVLYEQDLELEDYKSRIEKAVEYINNNLLYSEDFDYDEEDNLVWQGARCDTQSEDLLNILNGRSDKEMNIENITSNEIGLSNNGRFMQIEIYEKEIKRLQQEIQRKDNIINELKKHIGEEWYCYDNESIEFKVAKDVLDKIKELEKM